MSDRLNGSMSNVTIFINKSHFTRSRSASCFVYLNHLDKFSNIIPVSAGPLDFSRNALVFCVLPELSYIIIRTKLGFYNPIHHTYMGFGKICINIKRDDSVLLNKVI